MRRVLAFLLLPLLLTLAAPGAGQGQPEAGLAQAYDAALVGALRTLPAERAELVPARLAALDRLATSFDDSQRLLGERASGPMLRTAAPAAASLRGSSADAGEVQALVADASAIRAGRLGAADMALAAERAALARAWLDAAEPAASRAAPRQAWVEADAWLRDLFAHLRDVPPPPPPAPRIEVVGELWPGGSATVRLRAVPEGATVRLPWTTLAAPAGASSLASGIPFTQPLGPHRAELAVAGRTLAADDFEIVPIPLELRVAGPRRLSAGEQAQYTITAASPVPVGGALALQATLDGDAVPVDEGRLRLGPLAAGTYVLEVRGGPGRPWASDTEQVEVVVLSPSAAGGQDPATPEPRDWLWLIGALAAALVAALVAARLARGRGRLPAASAAAAAAATGGAGARLRAWWGSPSGRATEDFRAAARILHESGRLPPRATHDDVAAALREQGMPPALPERLAESYERATYAADPQAEPWYWRWRRRR
ncbi:MAG TPA: hypothetical protein VFH47_07595 [Candidatus Thermoplasmatota archaeon]|nr:hypothetical protein [Candidatus Thermoplasmatota archaeon]